MSDDDAVCRQVDRKNVAIKELNPFKKFAHRIDDVGDVEVACGNFVQHWSKQEEILTIDQGDLDVGIAGQLLFEFESGVDAAKSAAQNKDLLSFFDAHTGISLF